MEVGTGAAKRYRLARPNGDTDPLPPELAKLEGKSLEDLNKQYNSLLTPKKGTCLALAG